MAADAKSKGGRAAIRKYKEYIQLYMEINNGSTAGAATFAQFYWRWTYLGKYSEDMFTLLRSGY